MKKSKKKTWLVWGILLVAGWLMWKHAKAEATTPVLPSEVIPEGNLPWGER